MTIGENIRRLRRGCDITQEQLAGLMYITPQAVSRWENGTTAPDAESIIALARIFNCSADDILGLGADKREDRIRYYKELAHKAAEPRPGDADGSEVIRVYRDALREYPGDFELMKELSGALSYYAYYYKSAGRPEIFDSMMKEACELLEYIIGRCSDGALVGDVCRSLYSILRYALNKPEEAAKYLKYFPELGQCREMQEYKVGTPSEIQLIEQLAYYLMYYEKHRLCFKSGREEQLEIIRRIEALDELYGECHQPGDFHSLIWAFAKLGMAEKALHYLSLEAELAVKYDDPGTDEYKSEQHNTPPDYRRQLAGELENQRYDFIRDRDEFARILESVRA